MLPPYGNVLSRKLGRRSGHHLSLQVRGPVSRGRDAHSHMEITVLPKNIVAPDSCHVAGHTVTALKQRLCRANVNSAHLLLFLRVPRSCPLLPTGAEFKDPSPADQQFILRNIRKAILLEDTSLVVLHHTCPWVRGHLMAHVAQNLPE